MLLVGHVTGGSGITSSEFEAYLSQADVSRALFRAVVLFCRYYSENNLMLKTNGRLIILNY